MALDAVTAYLPPPPSQTQAGPMLAAGISFDTLDRQARGAIHFRSLGEPEPIEPRLRRRGSAGRGTADLDNPANDRRDGGTGRSRRREFGLHFGINPFPEWVLHSSAFVAQLIAQQFSPGAGLPQLSSEEGASAYGLATARTESFFGQFQPVEFAA